MAEEKLKKLAKMEAEVRSGHTSRRPSIFSSLSRRGSAVSTKNMIQREE